MKNKNQLMMILALSSLLSILFLVIRIYLSARLSYIFLVWNLVLAWAPFVISLVLKNIESKTKSRVAFMGLFFTWLLFFPNAPYILTDLIHLKERNDIPLWFDLLLILSFAWNGLILGFSSLFEIHKLLNRKFKEKISWIIIFGLLFLTGFGIYLGRFERWNSWDIITNPIALMSNVANQIIHPIQHLHTFGITLFFSLFLIVSYLTLSVLTKMKNYEAPLLPGRKK